MQFRDSNAKSNEFSITWGTPGFVTQPTGGTIPYNGSLPVTFDTGLSDVKDTNRFLMSLQYKKSDGTYIDYGITTSPTSQTFAYDINKAGNTETYRIRIDYGVDNTLYSYSNDFNITYGLPEFTTQPNAQYTGAVDSNYSVSYTTNAPGKGVYLQRYIGSEWNSQKEVTSPFNIAVTGTETKYRLAIQLPYTYVYSNEFTVKPSGTGTPLCFTDSGSYDIPYTVSGEAIIPVNVSSGVSGGVLPYTYSLSKKGGGFTWIKIDPSTGIITVDNNAGTWNASTVIVTVKDAANDTASIEIAVGAVSASEHTHSWTTDYPGKDETYHWNTCSGCSEIKNKAAHVYDADSDTTCNVCGYVRTIIAVTKYNITVTNGKATIGAGTLITKATNGTVVTLTANAPASGKRFKNWTVTSGGVTLANSTSATTTFTMGTTDVAITANYEALKTGWVQIGTTWYYYKADECGKAATGWEKISGAWYLFATDGKMLTGWQKSGSSWYLLASSGKMLTGWQKSGSSWYLLASSGKMLTGWQKSGGAWYLLASSGKMLTGWQKSGTSWYYLASSGKMQTGWQKIGASWYYFHGSGIMATSQWIGKDYVNAKGVWSKSR